MRQLLWRHVEPPETSGAKNGRTSAQRSFDHAVEHACGSVGSSLKHHAQKTHSKGNPNTHPTGLFERHPLKIQPNLLALSGRARDVGAAGNFATLGASFTLTSSH